MLTAKRFLLALALSAATALPAAGQSVEELVDTLGDPLKASGMVDTIVAKGEPAIRPLIGEALEGSDLVKRGWAIVCLSHLPASETEQALTSLLTKDGESALVKTWAAAARIQLAQDLTTLSQRARQLVPLYPACERPTGKKLQKLLGSEQDKKKRAEALLGLAMRVPQLQGSIMEPITQIGSGPLVELMVSGPNNDVRRMAAAYLANLAGQGQPVGQAVVESYAFDADAQAELWQGGALFIPGINWPKDEAKALAQNLLAWLVWADGQGRKDLQQQLHNNLRSLNLARAAGYQSPGWREVDVKTWLMVWKKAYGEQEVMGLLAKQGAQGRYPGLFGGQ